MQFQVTIPQDKTVFKYGKDITLSCHVKGYPIPAIRWYKNNTPLPKSSRYTQTKQALYAFFKKLVQELNLVRRDYQSLDEKY